MEVALAALAGLIALGSGAWIALLIRRVRSAGEENARLAESLDRLGSELVEAEQRERERIAQELHDGPLQALLVANQDLIEVASGSGDVVRAQEIVAGTIGDVRQAVADIHPATVIRGGLSSALRVAGETAGARGGFEVWVDVEHQAEGHHDSLVLVLARELLTNAAKHAEAQRVTVMVSEEPGMIVLAVEDNGIGMPPEALLVPAADGHLGLASVAARASAVGGTLEFDSRRERTGTIARVRLPKVASLGRFAG